MRAYVISLPRSVKRREQIQSALTGCGIDFEFVDAVDGRSLSPEQRAELIDHAAVERHPQWLTDPAIGCTLSHRLAYGKFLDSGEDGALILEDDAAPSSALRQLLQDLEGNYAADEVIQLYFRSFKPCRLRTSTAVELGSFRILEAVEPRQVLSTVGYVIGATAARRLYDSLLPVAVSADSWGYQVEQGAISRVRCVLPRPLDHVDAVSTIGYGSGTSLLSSLKQRQIPGIAGLKSLNRSRIARRMTRAKLVD